MSASKLICYFSSHQATFGLRPSSSPDSIPLNPANKTDLSLSDLQTGIGVAVHTSLDTEQFISHTRTALVDTIASLQGSDGGVIPVSEVHELLIEIHDILGNAMFEWVGYSACILVYLFNSAYWQCHEL